MKPRITAAVLAVLTAPMCHADDAMNYVTDDLVTAGLEEPHRLPEHGEQTVYDYTTWFLDGEVDAEV